jgi:uncharacterized membrane protein YfcA
MMLGLVLSAMIGLSLGLLGGGGSIITVPVLVYVLGVAPRQSIGMSLAVVGCTSLIGVGLHARKGAVDVKAGVFFGVSGVLGSYFGSRLTYLVPPSTLLLSFAILMIAIALVMLIRRPLKETEAGRKQLSPLGAIMAGFIVGVLTGFLGVGGGFLIVPALLLFGGLSMKDAVGTSLLVISLNCGAGLLGHIQQEGFDVRLTVIVTMLAAAGAVFGAMLASRTSPVRLRTGFAILVLTVGIFLIAKNIVV